MTPFAQLPVAIRARLGELDAGWADEPRADCDACPPAQLGELGVPYPFSMARDARCCTAQPNLANFLVGRVVDAEVVRRRIADRDGVSAWGIRATAGYDAAFPARGAAGFGRDLALRCPFWVGGEHACGVWAGRSARCRAFFCRHERGLDGARAWSQAGEVGVVLEAELARFLVETLGGVADTASDDELCAWYARCAGAADRLDDAAAATIVGRLTGDTIAHSPRGQLIAKLRVHRRELPERLVPSVSAVERTADAVWLAGYSTFDAVRAPSDVFAWLAQLDGVTPWRDVPGVDEALVRELHRVGALEAAP